MQRRVKDFFGHIDRISNDNDLGNAMTIWSLVDTAPNDKKLCFSTGNMNYMVDSLGDRVVVGVHMQYRCSNIILDASISDYNSSRRGGWQLDNYVVKLLSANFIIFLLIM